MITLTLAAAGFFAKGISLDGIDNRRAIAAADQGIELIEINAWAALVSSFLANWLAGVRPRL